MAGFFDSVGGLFDDLAQDLGGFLDFAGSVLDIASDAESLFDQPKTGGSKQNHNLNPNGTVSASNISFNVDDSTLLIVFGVAVLGLVLFLMLR